MANSSGPNEPIQKWIGDQCLCFIGAVARFMLGNLKQ